MTNPADKANIIAPGLPFNITVQGSIMMNGNEVVRGVEGKNLTIVCIAGKPPVETLVLSINGSNITNEGSDRITYSFIPTKLDNMKLFTCSAYSSLLVNPLSSEVRLDIQYSPVVEIRRKLTKTKLILVCNPSGNPDNFTFGDWEHWSEFKEHIRNVQGTSDVPPKFVNSNKQIQFGRYGKETNLTVLVYNKYGTLKTNLLQRNKTLNIHGLQRSIDIHEMVQDVNITVACIQIIFQLTLNRKEDCTDYKIEACNKKGCNELMVKIKWGTTNSTVDKTPPVQGIVIVVLVLVNIVIGVGIGVFVRFLKQKTKKRTITAANVRASKASNDDSIVYEDILEDENHQTPSQENENSILSTVNTIGVEKRDKDIVSSENALVASGNNIEDGDNDDGIYALPYKSLVVRYCTDDENVNLITEQNLIYENETSLDNSAYEMSPEFLQDTSPEDQTLPIYENVNHQTSSQENENPILSTVNIVGVEKRDKDTLSSENVSVASDNNDGIYEQPYASLGVQSCADNGNVYLITKQNSIYENKTYLDNTASEISSEFLQDTSPEEQELPVYENVVEEEVHLN
ncbi:Hypothetical predicted protein [Mytilus galloprovincialis]|uniref:Uncharacterized protein n=1 Tax=Mytilus galloprovincialis TaxID=29158 RepID=A0A8B6GWT5_MYTGA|nr:Hypothetical predicted protein [Mytilus galloprovincialis]